MRTWRFHRKVWYAWGRWWAIQVVWMPEFSFGIRVEPRRPLIDVFLGVATVAIGRHPILQDPRYGDGRRHSGRGFIPGDRLKDAPL